MQTETDWDAEGIVARRNKYFAGTLRKFTPYRTPLVLKRGQRQYVWDEHGNRLVDLLAMNVCISAGHAHPDIGAAAREQAESLQHCTTMFYHPVPVHFAEELVATMPEGHDWAVHFTSSGAEAIDLALMIARTYTGNLDVVSLQEAYHGPTYGAQSITGIAGFRHPVGLPGNVQFVPTPNQYSGILGAGVDPYLDALEATIQTGTSGKLGAIVIEPLQGYGGIVPMPAGYISGAAERVRAAGGLCVIDEVQSGVGRTGANFWAFEAHGIVPDIVVMAKGIGNGYPLGAVVTRREYAEPLQEKFLFHTYGSNPICCSVGRAVLKVIAREQLQQNAHVVGQILLEGLQELQQRHGCIGDVRGAGLMLAVELVLDRRTKAPATEETAEVFEETRRQGLVVSKSGANRNVLRLVPPLCLSSEDVPGIIEALDRSFAILKN